MAEEKRAETRPARCPICGRPSQHDYRPFCSRRCADVDLSRWLRGSYAIPGIPEREEPDAMPAPEKAPQDLKPGKDKRGRT